MIVYDNSEKLLGSDVKLIGKKLAACDDKYCLACGSREDLYSVEYKLSTYRSYRYGIHCEDCAKKIFKFAGKIYKEDKHEV